MAKVEIYSKAMCPYCDRAKQLLSAKSVDYTEIRVDLHPDQFETMMQRANGRRTFPQIFINEKPIGGFDDLWALEQTGKLDEMLKNRERK